MAALMKLNQNIGLEAQFSPLDSPQTYVSNYFAYLTDVLQQLDTAIIEAIIQMLVDAAQRESSIFLIGNGGSAATASHMANDLAFGGWMPGYPPFRVVALTDNVPTITAIGNDITYDDIFAYQLRALIKPGDVLLAFSVSGNSPNILRAVEVAKLNQGHTIGCCGFDGGTLREISDLCLHIPSFKGEYGPVEDVMMILDHVIITYLMLSRKGTLLRS